MKLRGREMGKIGTRLPSFCLNRIKPHVRVRSPPTNIQSNNIKCNGAQNEQKLKDDKSGVELHEEKDKCEKIGRKIMIVVDSSCEAKSALLWALSHTVQSQDVVILLHVTKPSKHVTNGKECTEERASRGYAVVNSLKRMSQLRRPEIEIETRVVEGKEKGPLIVEEANKRGAALLVIGQKKRSMTWRLIMMWATNKLTPGSVVEYCIQNAPCMAVAVRRKSKKHGGFLITTKRHKDFWLLA